MPEDGPQFRRFERRDDARSCASRGRQGHDGCPRCAAQVLRPYRTVRRYRADKPMTEFDQARWCDLWRLQPGDVSWPDTRRG